VQLCALAELTVALALIPLCAGTLIVAVGDHLTALKHKLDSEFGTSLLDMQSFLRTEKDAMAAASEGQLCGGATLSFVQMTQQVTRLLDAALCLLRY
jgi:hypothetical protein